MGSWLIVEAVERLWPFWEKETVTSDAAWRYGIAFESIGCRWVGTIAKPRADRLFGAAVVLDPSSKTVADRLVAAVCSVLPMDYEIESQDRAEIDLEGPLGEDLRQFDTEELSLSLMDARQRMRGGETFGKAATAGLEAFRATYYPEDALNRDRLLKRLRELECQEADAGSVLKSLPLFNCRELRGLAIHPRR